MNKKQERLIKITADDIIDNDELDDFIYIQEKLEKISVNVETLQLWSERMLASGAIDEDAEYYIAVTGAPYIYSTCGGVEVDDDMHVVKEDGTSIQNLYSVGTDSMGVLFTNKKGYANFGGVAQGYVFTSGRIAGTNAAKAVSE